MPEPGGGVGDNDRVALTFLAVLGAPTLLGFAVVWWGNGVRWLVAHGVLVDAAQHPMLAIPGLDGAGLDVPRTTVAAAVLLALLAVAVSAAWRAWLARRQVSST